jgi:hypothetical protein
VAHGARAPRQAYRIVTKSLLLSLNRQLFYICDILPMLVVVVVVVVVVVAVAAAAVVLLLLRLLKS